MTQPAGLQPAPDDATALSGNAVCLRCRYDLRGLGEDLACPECGLPLRATREGTPLLHAPPPWLRHLGLACAIEAASIAGLFVYHLALLNNWLPNVRPGNGTGDHPFPLRMAMWIGSDALSFLGAWMLTQPQPHARERALSRRKLV